MFQMIHVNSIVCQEAQVAPISLVMDVAQILKCEAAQPYPEPTWGMQ